MTIADARSLAVLAGIAALVAGLLVAIEPSAVLSIATLPGILIVVWLAWGAMRNSRTALLLLLFVAVFLIDAVFRVREYENKDLDFQVILKLGVWLTIASVAFFHARDWLDRMFTPTNFPVVLFLLWLFASTINSPVPMPLYGTVAAFSIFAYVAFAAYLFSQLEEVEVFAVLTITLVIFCLVSIAVYFALPELGRFTYWEGEVRYQSNRMSGIAGSANNMGRVAALALIVIGLYAREFHRLHRFFVPIAALVSGVALVMTNSRTSMATVAVILFAVYFMNWRRLYIGVFLLSAGLVALALVLPAGDQILALVSRSGSIDEVTSLTGRTEIWYAVAKLSEAYPLSGYGYASSIFILPQHAHLIGDQTSQAHNLMLQLLLTTGWIGVVLFTVAVLGVALRAIATGDRTVLALLSFVLLNGITEASGFATVANICSLAFALAVTLPPPRTVDADDYSYQRGFS